MNNNPQNAQPQQPQQPQVPQPVNYLYQQPQQPVKKKKKWWIIAIVVVLVLLMLKACFSGGSSNNSDTTNGTTSNSTATNNSIIQDKGKLGDYEVEIVSAEVTKDFEGKPALLVEFNFTNNSTKNQSFMWAMSYKAFQDGIEAETAVLSGDKTDGLSKEIKPGKSLTVYAAFSLNDTTTPVDIEVTELITLSDNKVVKTFNLK